WDLAEDQHSITLIESMHAAGNPVALVCHAPGALRNVKAQDGSPLVKGKRVTGFTNTEEQAVQLTKVVPFLVEDELKPWQHDAGHRLGVSYPNSQLASRYGAASMASRSAMTRSGSVNAARSAGTGSYSRFGNATSSYANRSAGTQGARSTAPQNVGRANSGQWQSFQGAQRNQAPAQGFRGSQYQSPGQRYSAPAQRYSAPAQRYSAPAQRYSAPVQRYSAPAQRYSAPSSVGHSYGGGSVSRSYSSGGGARSSGGGGARRSGGGGSHRGGRRQ